jgi:hypothetical protein
VHPRISVPVAEALGVASRRRLMLAASADCLALGLAGAGGAVEAFGQSEALTTRLRHIIQVRVCVCVLVVLVIGAEGARVGDGSRVQTPRSGLTRGCARPHPADDQRRTHNARRLVCKHMQDYPEGPGVLLELVQNADDAGATRVAFLLDARQHGTASLLGAGMAALQGPALLAYNDAVFSPGGCAGRSVQLWRGLRARCKGASTAHGRPEGWPSTLALAPCPRGFPHLLCGRNRAGDFTAIARIGQDGKMAQPAAIGRFGLVRARVLAHARGACSGAALAAGGCCWRKAWLLARAATPTRPALSFVFGGPRRRAGMRCTT